MTVALIASFALDSPAQQTTANSQDTQNPQSVQRKVLLRDVPRNIAWDIVDVSTSPLKLRARDFNWAVPFAFATAFTFGVDQAVERNLPTTASTINRASSLSNYGAAAMGGAVAASYFWGLHTKNDRLRETGLLAGEAAVDSVIFTTGFKLAARRERPTDGSGQGDFFKSGSAISSSFPSQHAAASWAIATVLANEYPGPLTKVLAYGGAGAISVSRIVGRKHFASDVFLGSALGWYLGHEVYKNRSSRSESEDIGTVVRDPDHQGVRSSASPYVPLDSWVYPAFDRLNALGFAPTALIGLRPWTRSECARLLQDIHQDPALEERAQQDAPELLDTLDVEFAYERAVADGDSNGRARIESVYSRSLGIAGTPLNDPLHFGQTIVNDYGRHSEQGFNQIVGTSVEAEAGPIAVYVRGEYQRTPSADALPLPARMSIAASENLPLMPGSPLSSESRFRLLDSYVAVNMHDWQLSFGKQSLWWGPGSSGDLMMSDNAEPLWMLRLSRVSPLRLPGLLRWLGPVRNETFLGQIHGYHFLRLGPTFNVVGSWESTVDPQPFIWGDKINFRPTQNLELGFSFTSVFAGLGRPMTLDTFRHTLSNRGNAQDVEPGDRRTGFDFSYRLPGLRRWITLYNGSMAEDEPNPIAYPRRAAMNPGIYITRLPRIPKLDFRAEAVYTNLPGLTVRGAFYTNAHYAGGYTNYGGLMGNWVGPQGRGLQLTSTYWMSAISKVQLGWRQQTVDPSYIQGGNLQDFTARYDFQPRSSVAVSTWVQVERSRFPALGALPNHNAALAISLSYRPKNALIHR